MNSTTLESTPDLASQVDALFADIRPDMPGCAIAVMQAGKMLYQQGYGMANLEYDIPITPASVFHIASISKQFTAMAVALLADQGQLDWNDDIRRYVPGLPDYGKSITLRHLVHHTGGVRDQWELSVLAGWRWDADLITQGDALDFITQQTALNFLPGEQFLYSNSGCTLLVAAVEQITGQCFREFTWENIFQPLGMHNTHFHDDYQMIVKDRAYGYKTVKDEEGKEAYKISIPDYAIVGATSLLTTVADMAHWDRNFITGEVGGQRVLQDLEQRGVLNSGAQINHACGLFHGEYRGLTAVGHGGADAGYRSMYIRYPEQQLSVVVLCNHADAKPEDLANRVAEVYLGEIMTPKITPDKQDKTTCLSDAALKRLEGIYLDRDSARPVRVSLKEDHLSLDYWSIERALIPVAESRFYIQQQALHCPRVEVSFELNESGEGRHLHVKDGPTTRTFTRIVSLEEGQETCVERLKDLPGTYHSDEVGTDYTVTLNEDGKLYLFHRKHGVAIMKPVYPGGFRCDIGGFPFVMAFTRNTGGEVSGFTVSDPRVWNLSFKKCA